MESIIRTIWNIEVILQQKGSGKPDRRLALTDKKARYMCTFFFVISFKKIAELSIKFGLNHEL